MIDCATKWQFATPKSYLVVLWTRCFRNVKMECWRELTCSYRPQKKRFASSNNCWSNKAQAESVLLPNTETPHRKRWTYEMRHFLRRNALFINSLTWISKTVSWRRSGPMTASIWCHFEPIVAKEDRDFLLKPPIADCRWMELRRCQQISVRLSPYSRAILYNRTTRWPELQEQENKNENFAGEDFEV